MVLNKSYRCIAYTVSEKMAVWLRLRTKVGAWRDNIVRGTVPCSDL